MRISGIVFAAATLGLVGGMGALEAANPRLNPMVELLSKKQPVFGLYVPSNPRGGGGGRAGAAAPTTPPPAAKTPAELEQLPAEHPGVPDVHAGIPGGRTREVGVEVARKRP